MNEYKSINTMMMMMMTVRENKSVRRRRGMRGRCVRVCVWEGGVRGAAAGAGKGGETDGQTDGGEVQRLGGDNDKRW